MPYRVNYTTNERGEIVFDARPKWQGVRMTYTVIETAQDTNEGEAEETAKETVRDTIIGEFRKPPQVPFAEDGTSP